MDQAALLSQAERAIETIRKCREDAIDFMERRTRDLLPTGSGGADAKAFIEHTDKLAGITDRLLLYLRRRDRFVEHQLALETRLLGLDETRLQSLAQALAGARPLFQNVPEFRDQNLLPALQQISQRIEEFDRTGEATALEFNDCLREVRRFWATRGWGELKKYASDLPEEFSF